MTPWPVLFSRLPQLVEKLEAIAHPLLTVEVDGELVAWLVRPSRTDLEGWLLEALGQVRRYYPEPRERVTLYAGTHPVAVVRRREGSGHAA